MPPAIRLHVVWARPTLLTDDDVITTFDFAVHATPWPDAAPRNYETAETYLDTWWNALRVYYANEHVLAQYRWYREDDNEPPWGAPARVTTKNVPGTSGAHCLPPQVAVTCTERLDTDTRRHWGRFYMPAPAVNGLPGEVLEQNGRITSGFTAMLADKTRDLYNAMALIDLIPVVRLRQDGANLQLRINEISVDDIFDVIRSRRYSYVGRRDVRTITDLHPGEFP